MLSCARLLRLAPAVHPLLMVSRLYDIVCRARMAAPFTGGINGGQGSVAAPPVTGLLLATTIALLILWSLARS